MTKKKDDGDHDLQVLSLENVGHMDSGVVGAAFNREVGKAIADCNDRPTLKTAREVILRVKIRPIAVVTGHEENGSQIITLEGAQVEPVVPRVKLPDVVPAVCDMGIRTQGPDNQQTLVFSPSNPQSHRQGMLNFGTDVDVKDPDAEA